MDKKYLLDETELKELIKARLILEELERNQTNTVFYYYDDIKKQGKIFLSPEFSLFLDNMNIEGYEVYNEE